MRASFGFGFGFASLLLLACSGSSSSDVLGPGGASSSSSSGSSSGSSGSTTTTTTPTDPGDPPPTDTSEPPVTPPPVTSPPATPADCDVFAAKFCPKADACHHVVAKMLGTDCESRVAGICKSRLSAPGTGFTQAALASCGIAYATMTCDQAFGAVQPAACNFKGTLPLNSECAFDDQCASGACAGNDDDECGTCAAKPTTPPAKPLGKLGDACDNSGQSAPACNTSLGLWCGASTNTCVEMKFVALGEACGFVGNELVMCAQGGTCKYGAGGSGTCVAQKPIGASCTSASGYEECAFGTSCIGGKCAYPTAAAICQ